MFWARQNISVKGLSDSTKGGAKSRESLGKPLTATPRSPASLGPSHSSCGHPLEPSRGRLGPSQEGSRKKRHVNSPKQMHRGDIAPY